MGRSQCRRVYIDKATLNPCGCSIKCPGCRAAEAGVLIINHAEDSLARVNNKLEECEMHLAKNCIPKKKRRGRVGHTVGRVLLGWTSVAHPSKGTQKHSADTGRLTLKHEKEDTVRQHVCGRVTLSATQQAASESKVRVPREDTE